VKVAITGGAGFIGFHLASAHALDGDDVTLIDSLAKSGGAPDPDLAGLLAGGKVKLVRFDLATDGASLVGLGPFDIVYHLAAINGTQLFYDIPYELARINLRITLNLLDALAVSPPRRLVYTSSSEVYADAESLGALKVPTDESAPVVFTQPTAVRFSYGTSKFMGEFLCLRFGERYGVPTTVVRYHNVYGPRMGDRHVVPQLLERIEQGEDPLRVYGTDETRAFCYVSDAVEATRRVAAAAPADIVHIGDPRNEVRIDDLAGRLLRLLGRKVPIVEAGRRDGSVSRRCPDISRLEALTGFSPRVSLDDGLERTAKWYVPRLSAQRNRPTIP